MRSAKQRLGVGLINIIKMEFYYISTDKHVYNFCLPVKFEEEDHRDSLHEQRCMGCYGPTFEPLYNENLKFADVGPIIFSKK